MYTHCWQQCARPVFVGCDVRDHIISTESCRTPLLWQVATLTERTLMWNHPFKNSSCNTEKWRLMARVFLWDALLSLPLSVGATFSDKEEDKAPKSFPCARQSLMFFFFSWWTQQCQLTNRLQEHLLFWDDWRHLRKLCHQRGSSHQFLEPSNIHWR